MFYGKHACHALSSEKNNTLLIKRVKRGNDVGKAQGIGGDNGRKGGGKSSSAKTTKSIQHNSAELSTKIEKN
jgi:hypothetical protein